MASSYDWNQIDHNEGAAYASSTSPPYDNPSKPPLVSVRPTTSSSPFVGGGAPSTFPPQNYNSEWKNTHEELASFDNYYSSAMEWEESAGEAGANPPYPNNTNGGGHSPYGSTPDHVIKHFYGAPQPPTEFHSAPTLGAFGGQSPFSRSSSSLFSSPGGFAPAPALGDPKADDLQRHLTRSRSGTQLPQVGLRPVARTSSYAPSSVQVSDLMGRPAPDNRALYDHGPQRTIQKGGSPGPLRQVQRSQTVPVAMLGGATSPNPKRGRQRTKSADTLLHVKEGRDMEFYFRLTRGGDFWCTKCQLGQLLALKVVMKFYGIQKHAASWQTIPCQFQLANEKQKDGTPDMEEHRLHVAPPVWEEGQAPPPQEGPSTRRNRYMKITIVGAPPGQYTLGSTVLCTVEAQCHKCNGPLNINHTMKRNISFPRKSQASPVIERKNSVLAAGGPPPGHAALHTGAAGAPSFPESEHRALCAKEVGALFGEALHLHREQFIDRWRASPLATSDRFVLPGEGHERVVGSGDFTADYLYQCMAQLGFVDEAGRMEREAFALRYEALRPLALGVTQMRQMNELFPAHQLGFSSTYRMLKLVCGTSGEACLIRSFPQGEYALVRHVAPSPADFVYDHPHPSLKSLLLDYLSSPNSDVCRRCL